MPTVALIVVAALACDPEQGQRPDELRAEAEVIVDAGREVEVPTPAPDAALLGFDEARQMDIYDSDHDGFPDLTEAMGGTDVYDSEDSPIDNPADARAAGFPSGSCRYGFENGGSRLCISSEKHPARQYARATRFCRARRSHVCTYEDFAYLYLNSNKDVQYSPLDAWIGNMIADDQVLCGNRELAYNNEPNIWNFEGTCEKWDNRPFWCCHDHE